MEPVRQLPEYRVWYAMKTRCSNPNAINWPHYGGRGIRVCQEWYNSFRAFYAYVGPRPSPKAQLDRIDNDGDYEPGNVRWISRTDNMRNSTVAKLTVDQVKEIKSRLGSERNVDIAQEFGIGKNVISDIRNGRTWKDVSPDLDTGSRI